MPARPSAAGDALCRIHASATLGRPRSPVTPATGFPKRSVTSTTSESPSASPTVPFWRSPSDDLDLRGLALIRQRQIVAAAGRGQGGKQSASGAGWSAAWPSVLDVEECAFYRPSSGRVGGRRRAAGSRRDCDPCSGRGRPRRRRPSSARGIAIEARGRHRCPGCNSISISTPESGTTVAGFVHDRHLDRRRQDLVAPPYLVGCTRNTR